MSMSINSKAWKAEYIKMLQSLTGEVEEAVLDTTLYLHTEIVQGIKRGPATGRLYTRGNISHRASAPGEAPMSDTGALARSVRFDNITDTKSVVYSVLKHAPWLEYGTSKMKPRPIWRPSIDKASKKLRKEIDVRLRKAFA